MNTSNLILKARKDIIKFGYESGGSSHYGGALSMLDFLCVLYNEFLSQPKDAPSFKSLLLLFVFDSLIT